MGRGERKRERAGGVKQEGMDRRGKEVHGQGGKKEGMDRKGKGEGMGRREKKE
jgi:hypothetical protein